MLETHELVEEKAVHDSASGTDAASINAQTEKGAIDSTINVPPTDAPADGPPSMEDRHLKGMELVVVFTGLMLGILLIALDQTIVATAIPVIASHFNSLGDVSWIVGAYLLTQVAFMLTYGQALSVIPTKWVFLFSMFIFEVGSLFCGVAFSSTFLIFGRAVAGVGAGGCVVSVFSIIAESTALEKRAIYLSLIGAIFAISSCIGPLIGGALTQYVTWRWCFYINLPVGGAAVTFVAFFLPLRPPFVPAAGGKDVPAWKRFLAMDWIGSLLCLAMTVCLVLPLEWGGNQKAWNDPAVIALFCVFGVLLFAFLGWEWRVGDKGILPLKLLAHRSIAGCCITIFFGMINLLVFTYYLPLQYQAVQGTTASRSGVDILPFIVAIVFAGTVAGITIQKTGRYYLWLVIPPALSAIGAGLLHTTNEFSPLGKLIGFQILYGLGVGPTIQNTVLAAQAAVDGPHMIPLATGLTQFVQFLGGVVGIAVAGTIFNNELASSLATYAPDIDATLIRESVEAIKSLTGETKASVIHAYVIAIKDVYILGIPCAALSIAGALIIRNLDLRKLGPPGPPSSAA